MHCSPNDLLEEASNHHLIAFGKRFLFFNSSSQHFFSLTCWHCEIVPKDKHFCLPVICRITNQSGFVASNKTREENSVKVTTTGSLILYNFSEEMSGVYTCSLSYKHTAEEAQKIIQVKYVVYAFINPHFYYQFSARYHFVSCNSTYNISFEKKLLHILRTLLADLSCDVSSVKTECHLIKMQESGLQNELFFTFSVVPIENVTTRPDACTSSSCNPVERLDKAKDLIEKFFVQQARVLRKHFQILPEIYYIEGTLQTVWIRHCSPGYGMNALLHPNCPECCVICKPGTYNPHNGTQCLQCNSSMVYGAKKC
uniref:Zona pellucida-binding protein 1 isoform X2 n=1 Tax=Phascolarctos cinereus TaxID=38626 RepID=A0A6P5JX67_PHACI|nr:zona pellucida-binding protein 1 isoform X2 [Phascolarctos cinereus]